MEKPRYFKNEQGRELKDKLAINTYRLNLNTRFGQVEPNSIFLPRSKQE